MKFCFWGNILPGYLGKPIGGGEKQQYLITYYLSKLGHRVYIIDFKSEKDFVFDNVTIISLKLFQESSGSFNQLFSFYKLLKRINADIYYSRVRSSIHLIGLLIAKKQKKKFVYHAASDLDASGFKERYKYYYSKTSSFWKIIKHFFHSEILFPVILKKADLVIAQNAYQFNKFLNKKIKNILFVNNLFDFTEENYKINNKVFLNYNIIVGSFDRRKGIEELETLISKTPNTNYILIGKARDANGENFISKIRSKSNCKYIGHVNQEKVLELIFNANFLISTSFSEGFPNVFLEAWSIGIPVLSLYVNPSNVMNKYKLGKFYAGNLNELIHDLNNTNLNFNKNDCINYVIENHNPTRELKKLVNKLKVLS